MRKGLLVLMLCLAVLCGGCRQNSPSDDPSGGRGHRHGDPLPHPVPAFGAVEYPLPQMKAGLLWRDRSTDGL